MNAKRPQVQAPDGLKQKEYMNPVESILANHPFLAGIGPHQRRILTDCAMLVQFAPGELICSEGDPANRFYLINKGRVSLESYVRDRGAVPIQSIGAGDVLGWSWLMPPYYWHFDARAVEPTEAVFFYGSPLRQECEVDHEFGYEMLKRITEVIIKRLQATRRQLVECAVLPK